VVSSSKIFYPVLPLPPTHDKRSKIFHIPVYIPCLLLAVGEGKEHFLSPRSYHYPRSPKKRRRGTDRNHTHFDPLPLAGYYRGQRGQEAMMMVVVVMNDGD